MSNEPFKWEQQPPRPQRESSAFTKGFQGCLGVGCAIFVVFFALMVLGGAVVTK